MSLLSWLANAVKTEEEPKEEDNGYPKTVEEVLDDNIKYKDGTHAALKKFKESRPWEGTRKKIQGKICLLNDELAEVYKIEPPQVVFVRKFAYGCCYFPIGNIIIMEHEDDGRYSVVTFLHEFGHALGKGERSTCRWSINLFRHHFPKSFEKLEPKGHLLYRKKP